MASLENLADVSSAPEAVEDLDVPISIDAYVRALRALEPLNTTHRNLLVAHYRAPERTTTFTQLAQVVGLNGYRAVNMQYGALGKKVCEQLGCRLKTQVKIFGTFSKPPGSDWRLTMRSELAGALERLEWV